MWCWQSNCHFYSKLFKVWQEGVKVALATRNTSREETRSIIWIAICLLHVLPISPNLCVYSNYRTHCPYKFKKNPEDRHNYIHASVLLNAGILTNITEIWIERFRIPRGKFTPFPDSWRFYDRIYSYTCGNMRKMRGEVQYIVLPIIIISLAIITTSTFRASTYGGYE